MTPKEKLVEKLADYYHQRLTEYVGHPQALRETIAKAFDLAPKVLGSMTSNTKAAAARKNGRKGGRPTVP